MSAPSSIQSDIQSAKMLEVKTTLGKFRACQTAFGRWMFSITLPVMQNQRSFNDTSSRSCGFSILSLTPSFSIAAIKIFACWP